MINYVALVCLAALVVLDIIFGLLKAWMNNDISSTKMREGALHKATYIGLIALAFVVEIFQQYVDLGIDLPLVTPVCVFLALTEIASVLENLAAINPAFAASDIAKLFRSTKKDDVDA